MNGIPQHPAESRLEKLMRGVRLPEEEARAIIRHLLTGCPRCLAVTRRLWSRGEWPADLKALAAELEAPFRRRTVLEGGPGAL